MDEGLKSKGIQMYTLTAGRDLPHELGEEEFCSDMERTENLLILDSDRVCSLPSGSNMTGNRHAVWLVSKAEPWYGEL